MNKVIDEMDNEYNRLTVIGRDDNDKNGRACWLCRCSCGGVIVVSGISLRVGNTRSCGCLQQETRSVNVSSTKGRKDTNGQRKRKSVAHTNKSLSEEHKGIYHEPTGHYFGSASGGGNRLFYGRRNWLYRGLFA